MASPKSPPTSPRGTRSDAPPSASDEQLARSDRGKLFTDDGLKARDTERVGSMAPDTDPPDGNPRTYPPLRPRRP